MLQRHSARKCKIYCDHAQERAAYLSYALRTLDLESLTSTDFLTDVRPTSDRQANRLTTATHRISVWFVKTRFESLSHIKLKLQTKTANTVLVTILSLTDYLDVFLQMKFSSSTNVHSTSTEVNVINLCKSVGISQP